MRRLLCLILLCSGCFSIAASAKIFHGAVGVSNPKQFATFHPLGDSITCGAAADSGTSGVSECNTMGYANILASYGGSVLTNRGVSGDMACDMSVQEVFTQETPAASGNPLYSILIGTNDVTFGGAGPYEAVYNNCLLASLSWLTVPSTSKVYAQNATATGSWSADNSIAQTGIARTSSTNGATLTFNLTVNNHVAYLWYGLQDATGGTFNISIDGGSPVSETTSTTPAILTHHGVTTGDALARFSGLTNGSHPIVVTVTSATSASNPVHIIGVGTPPASNSCCTLLATGVPKQLNDANPTITAAYDSDAHADNALLAGDGLNILSMDIRSFLPSNSTFMFDSVHPNLVGHESVANGFESIWPH